MALPLLASPAPPAELLAAHGIQAVAPPVAAPDFTLPLLGGGESDLSASHGDWVVLTFFATWCGPCRQEMPSLEALHRRRGEDGLAVLAVSVDRSLDPVAPFAEQLDLTLPIFWDEGGQVGQTYRATSIPVSYLIDTTGRIVGMARGARDWSAAVALFDALKEAVPPAAQATSNYARLDTLALPEVLEPPSAEWSLPSAPLRPGEPFDLEVRLNWSGRLQDYLPQPPQLPRVDGIRRGRVAASSSSRDGSHLVRYRIELTATEAGLYELDPIELRYQSSLSDSPASTRVAGPTFEVVAAELAGREVAALAALAAVALTALLLYRRRLARHRPAPEAPPAERLRAHLDRAKARRLAGDGAGAYEELVTASRELETAAEHDELERRLEAVRFGGELPRRAELEAIERRLERALARLEPDPDAERRRRLRLRSRPDDPTPLTSKETTG